jgi:hypothetical protein
MLSYGRERKNAPAGSVTPRPASTTRQLAPFAAREPAPTVRPQSAPPAAPFARAGSTDILARLIGQWLTERLGQQFVIDNRPGGGGNIGTEAVVRASPDGWRLLREKHHRRGSFYDPIPYVRH